VQLMAPDARSVRGRGLEERDNMSQADRAVKRLIAEMGVERTAEYLMALAGYRDARMGTPSEENRCEGKAREWYKQGWEDGKRIRQPAAQTAIDKEVERAKDTRQVATGGSQVRLGENPASTV